MTKINAKVIADSKNEFGNRITTMVVTFPRIILAEKNTHRMLSKNSASSRAIPFEKMLKSVKENPFIPIAWQKDHKGMQGTEYLSKTEKFGLSSFIAALVDTLNAIADKGSKEYEDLDNEIGEKIDLIDSILQKYKFEEKTLDEWWLFARDRAIEAACIMSVFRVTKQLCNRLLEPFMWHTVIVTATEFENFFALRCPQYGLFYEQIPMDFRSKKDLINFTKKVEAPEFQNNYDNLSELDWLTLNKGQAEIHMMSLAEAMWDAYNESIPKELKAGEWHIPFGDNIDFNKLQPLIAKDAGVDEIFVTPNTPKTNKYKIKIATARCARVSYTVVGEEDKEPNYENDIKLHDRLAASGHYSPFEHCAQAMEWRGSNSGQYISGNFNGFTQYRKTLPNENII